MIICGYNEVTRNFQGKFIDEKFCEDGIICGDPAAPENLLKAGIKNDNILIVATEDDDKNVYITLLAKELNPKIKIGAIVKKSESVSKEYTAGADYVVLESELLGREVLRFLLAPKVASFMDRILISNELQLLGLSLPEKYTNRRIRDTDIRDRIGIIIAIKRGEKLIKKPSPDTILKKGDILIFLLQGKEINKIREIMGQWILRRD